MSPVLLRKHLDAARLMADHLVFTTDGFEFAPYPVLTDTDRDKYFTLEIVDFYKRQPTDLAEYFAASWEYRHRGALGLDGASLADIAAHRRVSARYLGTVYALLTDGREMPARWPGCARCGGPCPGRRGIRPRCMRVRRRSATSSRICVNGWCPWSRTSARRRSTKARRPWCCGRTGKWRPTGADSMPTRCTWPAQHPGAVGPRRGGAGGHAAQLAANAPDANSHGRARR